MKKPETLTMPLALVLVALIGLTGFLCWMLHSAEPAYALGGLVFMLAMISLL